MLILPPPPQPPDRPSAQEGSEGPARRPRPAHGGRLQAVSTATQTLSEHLGSNAHAPICVKPVASPRTGAGCTLRGRALECPCCHQEAPGQWPVGDCRSWAYSLSWSAGRPYQSCAQVLPPSQPDRTDWKGGSEGLMVFRLSNTVG